MKEQRTGWMEGYMDGRVNAVLQVKEKIRVDQSGISSEHTFRRKVHTRL